MPTTNYLNFAFLTKCFNNTKSSFFKCFISLSGWWWKLTKLPDYLSRFSGFKFDFKIEHFIHKKCDFIVRKVIKKHVSELHVNNTKRGCIKYANNLKTAIKLGPCLKLSQKYV